MSMEEIKLCGRCNKPKIKDKALFGIEIEDVSTVNEDMFCKCGRPTNYTNDEDMCAKVDEYLLQHQDSEEINQLGQEKLTVKLPTIEGLAIFLGVTKMALYDWEKEHKEFAYALEKVRQEQQQRLLNKGLSGQYNSTIAKLILSANHGMRERTDMTTNNKPIEGITFLPQKKDGLDADNKADRSA